MRSLSSLISSFACAHLNVSAPRIHQIIMELAFKNSSLPIKPTGNPSHDRSPSASFARDSL